MIHRYLLFLLICSSVFAEEPAKKAQRLEKVIWNPVSHVLTWEVSEGCIDVHGQYEPQRLVGTFSIKPQTATMSFSGEMRRFMPQEADHLHDVLDSLSLDIMSSALWWRDGKSESANSHRAAAVDSQ